VDYARRIDRLREGLPELEADAFLATSLPNVRYLTGFTGSNGQVLLSRERGAFFTDGRYERQASHEVPDLERVVYPMELAVAFAEVCGQLGLSRVAFEADDVTVTVHDALAQASVELVPTRGVVERIRWVKEPAERALLGDAQAIADQTFDEITGRLREGSRRRNWRWTSRRPCAGWVRMRSGSRASWRSARAPPSPTTARATGPFVAATW
jgi:Xaa-Pro aminopeptidase